MSLLKRIEQEKQTTRTRPTTQRPGPSQQTGAPQRQQMQVRRQPASPVQDAYRNLKERIQNRLIADLDPTMDVTKTSEVRRTIETMYDEILAAYRHAVAERYRFFSYGDAMFLTRKSR